MPRTPHRPLLRLLALLVAPLATGCRAVPGGAPGPGDPVRVATTSARGTPVVRCGPVEDRSAPGVWTVRGSEVPAFPADSGVPRDGSTVLAFTVDVSGRADLATVRPVRSTHPAFEAAMRAVLPLWRFGAHEGPHAGTAGGFAGRLRTRAGLGTAAAVEWRCGFTRPGETDPQPVKP